MVHHGHQHMFVIGEAEKCCPQRDLGGQIKTVTRRLLDGLLQPARRPAAGINNIPTEVGPLGRNDQLPGYALGRRKQGAQALLAAHHIGQRRTQRLGIKAPAQPQRHRHVVNRGGPLQLVQEPQPLLGERQRHHRGPLHRHQRLTPPRILTDTGRQLGNRGRLEHGAHRKAGIQAGVDRRDQAHRRNAVATQVEERVVDPDALKPQHLSVDTGQDLLDGVGRGAIFTSGVLRCR